MSTALSPMHRREVSLAGAGAVLLAIGALGCTGEKRGVDTRPVVAVSVPPQAYFVERLADAWVRIEVMLPPGTSPHTYEPTMQQVEMMEKAAVYVKVGHPKFPFEHTWLERLLSENPGASVVDCSRGVRLLGDDPHLWVAPSAVRAFVPDLAAALIAVVPGHRAEIEQRQSRLLADVDGVDADVRAILADLRLRRFYVFHPAWGYFARDYGLEQIPIETGSKEPDPSALAKLIARARADGARVVFVQPQFSRRSAELVASEIGARVVAIDPLARDWPDNMRRVARTLREALGG